MPDGLDVRQAILMTLLSHVTPLLRSLETGCYSTSGLTKFTICVYSGHSSSVWVYFCCDFYYIICVPLLQ